MKHVKTFNDNNKDKEMARKTYNEQQIEKLRNIIR